MKYLGIMISVQSSVICLVGYVLEDTHPHRNSLLVCGIAFAVIAATGVWYLRDRGTRR